MMVLIFFVLFHRLVSSELTMMLVYGVPSSLTGASINKTLNWKQCIQSCFDSESCVMAWQTGISCANYDYDSIGKVTQTDYNNGSIVAFKVENNDDICPIGTNPPTFNNQNATGSLFIDEVENSFPKWVYYSISLTGNIWNISFKVNVSCTSDFFSYFERKDGSSICITGYIDTSNTTKTGYSYQNAIDYCGERGAYPTGIWNSEDAEFLSNVAQSLRSSLSSMAKTNNTYIRIDGMRTEDCQITPETTDCMTVNGFIFNGSPVENFDAYNWVTSSSAMETLNDNCIVMVMNGTDSIKMDVRSCFSSGSPLPPKMILCSCPAWSF